MSRFTAIDGLLTRSADAGAVPGVVAVVVGPDGVLYEGAAGDATPDTMFRFASMTKAMASVAALALVEEGRLELDAPVASVLPEFGELQVLEGFDGDTPRLRPPATPGDDPPAPDAHRGPRLLVRQRGPQALPRGHRRADPFSRAARVAAHTAALRPGHRLELRDQHRLARAGRREGHRQGPGRGPGRAHLAAAGDVATRRSPRARSRRRGSCAFTSARPTAASRPRRTTSRSTPSSAPPATAATAPARDFGRFIAMLLAGGAPVLRPETVDLAFSDQLARRAAARADDHHRARARQRVRRAAVPADVGPWLPHHVGGPRRDAPRRHRRLGGPVQLLLLGRPRRRRRGGAPHPGPAVLRRGVIELLVGFEQAVYAVGRHGRLTRVRAGPWGARDPVLEAPVAAGVAGVALRRALAPAAVRRVEPAAPR